MPAPTPAAPAPAPAPAPDLIRSLPGILHAHARRDPDRTMLTALDRNGEPVATLTAGEFDVASRSLAADLSSAAAPGDRVVLPAMPGLRFHVAFLACLCARLVAVPVPPIRMAGAHREAQQSEYTRTRRFNRLAAICREAGPTAAVVPGGHIEELAAAWAGDETLGGLRLVPAEPRGEAGRDVEPEPVDGDEVAFLQYTSGSTAHPRGVMITHRAMLANLAALSERLDIKETTTSVSWLPLYHDMGLCLGVLGPVYACASSVIFEPSVLLYHPEQWLRAISGLPDVMSAAPDSAYAWCAKQVRDEAKSGLDLSRWRVAVNGAEPVRAETLRAFHAAFAGCGLSERALTPAYGMAEATLFVTAGSGRTMATVHRYDREMLGRGQAVPVDAPPGASGAPDASGAPGGGVELVGCGQPGPGIRVTVVDPETGRQCPSRMVGEIWVCSPGNGTGYWRRPEESHEVFGAVLADPLDGRDERWLRTGDLGFVDGGELFVTGRRKDLIVIHGANYYPQDIEDLVRRAHPLLEDGLAAACAADDENRVTVVVETADPENAAGAAEAASAAVRAVTAELPVATAVVVIPGGQLPRTTSGKVRRHECAERLRSGRFSVLAQWPHDRAGHGNGLRAPSPPTPASPTPASPTPERTAP